MKTSYNTNPKISVIMPFYNCEKYLDYSINSILNQTYKDFEFIIINDASNDNSDNIVKKYLYDKRIIYIKNEHNVGIVKNLNKGLELAKGEYIARMDGDDISILDRFEKQLEFIETNPNIGLVGGYAKLINENGIVIGEVKKHLDSESIFNNLFLFSEFIHPSVMIRSDIIKKKLYKEEFLYCEDYELWFRLIFNGTKGANLDKFLIYYRIHSNSSSKNSKIIAKKIFSLRLKSIKSYGLKVGLKGYLAMYFHYISGLILTDKQKGKVEKFIKKIIVKG